MKKVSICWLARAVVTHGDTSVLSAIPTSEPISGIQGFKWEATAIMTLVLVLFYYVIETGFVESLILISDTEMVDDYVVVLSVGCKKACLKLCIETQNFEEFTQLYTEVSICVHQVTKRNP